MKLKFPILISSSVLTSGIAVASVFLGWQAPASAVVFTGGSQDSFSATADFQITGNNLTLTLTNTSTADANVPSDVLTAVFFKLGNNTTLTLNSVSLSSGASLWQNGGVLANPGDIKAPFNGGWAMPNDYTNIPDGANQGLGTAGLGIFQGNVVNTRGQGGNFNYGLVGSGYTSAGDNAPVIASQLIKNSIVFNLTGVAGFTENDIRNVSFQYGTSLEEPRIIGNPPPPLPQPPVTEIPEPSTTVAIGLFALGVLGFLKKK